MKHESARRWKSVLAEVREVKYLLADIDRALNEEGDA
jgi:hypothetical protein